MNKTSKIENKKGFTMIELIVSMAIIMVVSVVGVVSFSSTSAKARDSRRMSDLERIRVALELFKQAYKIYPSGTNPAGEGVNWTNIMPQWPSDPKSGWRYEYNSVNGLTYTVSARLELGGGAEIGGSCGGVLGCNYQVRSP